ncbi:MAG TPA: Ig-like domain-containing protein, partial [Gemmataceae bacterium]|nr:Ig-like domain-containing protein [Gemmataceae bacterium]
MAAGLPRGVRRTVLMLEELEDRVTPTLLGNQLFPADNPWNQKITNAPVAANSAAIMNNIVTNYGNGRLHPDVGQDYGNSSQLYGIPYNVVHGNSAPKVNFSIDAYSGESDLLPVPVPANVVIEGDFQNGPNPTRGYGAGGRGDSHLLIYDVDNNVSYEFFNASRPTENADGKWHADGEAVWDMKADTFRTLGWTSADAAGLSLLVGLARPDEGLPVAQGGQGAIDHAIRVTLQNSIILNQFLYPASHVANPGNTNAATEPAMGARFRLKAGVDISQLNPEAKIIAQAMKDYGLIVADNGSNFYFSGAAYSVDTSNGRALTWDDNDIQDTTHGLKSLTFSDFEVVDLTPSVSGLSAGSGAPGTTVTVTGANFSGAAGHLQVLFGNTPSPSVTFLDDGHLTAVVPALANGAVDVRVQSGANAPGNPSNVENPVFGYGTSPVTAADRFSVITTPAVVSVVRANNAAALTNAASVAFTATFNESVLNVSAASFALTTTGAVSGDSITSVTGSGSVYMVTVATGTGDGTLRLDVQATNTIQDSAGNHLSGGYTGGQSYTLDHTPPAVQSIALAGASPTNAASVGYTVTFSEAVTGVNLGDFSLAAAGVSGAAIKSVTGSGAVYTVTVGTGSGNGTLRVDVKATTTIQDLAGNPLPATGYSGGPTYTIDKTAPTVAIAPVSPSPRNTAVGSVTITFSKAVLGFGLANLQLKISGGANLLTASQTLTTSDHVTWVLGNLAGLTDPTHRLVTFTLSLSAAGVTDAAGNALAGGASTSFVVLDPALALQGQTLTFTGTPGNDTFVYKAGGTANVTLNGVSYLVDPTLASTVSFVGNGGSDTVTLMAPAGGGNTLALSPGGGTLSGPGYTVRLSAVSQVVAVGGPADRAYFTGSAGADVFVGTPAYAYLHGAGYFNQADGFGVALAVGAGGSDTAYL